MKFQPISFLLQLRRAAPALALLAGAWIGQSWAAGTLADAPLFTSSAEQVKPNIMFILDNSGSMQFEYLPDAAEDWDPETSTRYGARAAQCNGLAFDPNDDYPAPPKYDGTSQGDKTTNGSDWIYYTYKGTQKRLGFTYNNGVVVKTSTFYKECASAVGDNPGKDVFTRVKVADQNATLRGKYANWREYYSSRTKLMKTAVAFAFVDLSDRFRVGFNTINRYDNSGNKLDIADFTLSHKQSFFNKLYNEASPTGGTPLRGALARAGRYYGNKLSGQTDPIQVSCQRNYAILSTDGYWNTGSGVEEFPNGPYQLNGTTKVGQQDGVLPRPMRDGASVESTTTTTWTTTRLLSTQTKTTIERVSSQLPNGGTVTKTPVSKIVETTYTAAGGSCGFFGTPYNVTTRERLVYDVSITGTGTSTKVGTTTTVTTEQKTITPMSQVVKEKDGTVTSNGSPTPGTASSTSTTQTNTATFGPALENGTITVPLDQETGGWSAPTSGGTFCKGFLSSAPQNKTETVDVSNLPAVTTTSPTSVATGTKTQTTTAGPFILKDQTTSTDKVSDTFESSTGGISNTLADVAAYYYNTDLRPDLEDNVPGTASSDAYRSFGDSAAWQHMTTFTLGLGVNGVLEFDEKYLTKLSGHFHEIVTGQRKWPDPKEAGGSEAWPANVDDLWHAAVNGRGQYFNANDPKALAAGLSNTLEAIKAVTGSASAASTSSLQPVAGDNDVYLAQFTSVEWTGDVLQYSIHPVTGRISKTPTWSARAELDKRTDARTIYYAKPAGGMEEFTVANLTSSGNLGKFSNFCSKTMATGSKPDQCADLTTTTLAAANTAANLVDYLRGEAKPYYRERVSKLGDIINASPLYVGRPRFRYQDTGYSLYANGPAKSRKPVVLAAANDGMLHAFDRTNGKELWSFIPSAVLDNLPRLADTAYGLRHTYFVDGSPVMGDIYVKDGNGGGSWKTIVVGGLNKGGRSYYALDVTDTENPKLLWEFKHDNLGFTFGNPIITKRDDGTWVVVFGSGYQNVSPGDGNGHLFVVDAYKGGAPLKVVDTFVDASFTEKAASSPDYSGLSKINGWVDSDVTNLTKRFYGGDLLGNLWRFDIDDKLEPKGKALLLAQLKLTDGTPQPVTTMPALAQVQYNGKDYPVVYVATGSYLRDIDPADKTVQSVYAIKDPLTGTGYGDLRKDPKFAVQTIKAGLDKDKRPTREQDVLLPVDWAVNSGWRVDFPVGGERVSVDPQLALDTLYVGSNLPKTDACTIGGESFLYRFNINTGRVTADYVGNVLLMGVTPVQLIEGENAIETIVTTSEGKLKEFLDPPTTTSGGLRRTAWRELVD